MKYTYIHLQNITLLRLQQLLVYNNLEIQLRMEGLEILGLPLLMHLFHILKKNLFQYNAAVAKYVIILVYDRSK